MNRPGVRLVRPSSPYGPALALGLAILAVPTCLRPTGDWDQVYVPAAERLRSGGEVFEAAYFYPPFAAWVAIPFTFLPPGASVVAWYGAGAAALVVLLRGSWRLAGGEAWPGTAGGSWREHVIVWAGLAVGLRYAFDCFANRQTDLVIAALMVAGCERLTARRDAAAGVLFGLAAALKCTPLLWAPYLAAARRFRAAGLVVLVAVAVNLLPDLTHPAPAGPRLIRWARMFVTPMLNDDYDPGTWAAGINFNHSVAGVCNRWLTVERTAAGGVRCLPAADRVSPAALKAVVYGIDGLFVVAAVAAVVVSRRAGRGCGAVEYSLVVLLMLLLSPQSSKPHYCALVLPGFCLARLATERRDRALGGLLAITLGATLVLTRGLLGQRASGTALWWGGVFWPTAALFGGCVYALWAGPRSRGMTVFRIDEPANAPRPRVAA